MHAFGLFTSQVRITATTSKPLFGVPIMQAIERYVVHFDAQTGLMQRMESARSITDTTFTLVSLAAALLLIRRGCLAPVRRHEQGSASGAG